MTTVTFSCFACNADFAPSEFFTHAKEVHGADPKKPWSKQATMFMDGAGWHKRIYKITADNGVEFGMLQEDKRR